MFGVKFKNTQAPQLWIIPVSFAFLILVGTIVLKMPFSLNPGQQISWVDSLFTATSAVCITGHSAISICDVFDFSGQMVLLFLIQMGGVGIFTSSLIMVVVVGQRLSLADEQVIQATVGQMRTVRPVDVFIYACFFIFFFEALGAVLYLMGANHSTDYKGLLVDPASGLAGDAFALVLWDSIFHSVSAFCNAGFSLYPEGMVRMKNSPYFLGLLSSLVVMGGLGLMTIINLRYWYFWRRNFMRRGSLLLQTKVTLLMTLIMIVFGTAVFLIFEYNHALKDCDGVWLKFFNSFFQAASSRTAGLNSIDLSQAYPVTLGCLMILMFIGGGSGSMAGGIKVTTFFVIVAAAWFVLRRKEDIQVFKRRIPFRLVHIALMIGVLFTSGFVIGLLCLIAIESGQPSTQLELGWLGIFFDGLSAYCTVGSSIGAVPLMTSGGKLVLVAMMYVGRILTLTLAVYLLRPWEKSYVKYPEEQISLS